MTHTKLRSASLVPRSDAVYPDPATASHSKEVIPFPQHSHFLGFLTPLWLSGILYTLPIKKKIDVSYKPLLYRFIFLLFLLNFIFHRVGICPIVSQCGVCWLHTQSAFQHDLCPLYFTQNGCWVQKLDPTRFDLFGKITGGSTFFHQEAHDVCLFLLLWYE